MIAKFTCPNCEKKYRIVFSKKGDEAEPVLTLEDLRESHPEVGDVEELGDEEGG